MTLLPAALLLLRAAPRRAGALDDGTWWGVLLFYAAAKAAELADHAIFTATGLLSGHTLKHLLAATGAAWLLRALVTSGSRR